jgi:arylsulfatase A-like enzyme
MTPGRSGDFAHAIDLFPTIAAASGVKAPANLPGVNLLDTGARQDRKHVFGVTHSIFNITLGDPDDTQQYLWCVEDEWKLIVRYAGADTTKYRATHAWDTAPARLFNLKDDPHETKDLAKERPEVVARLRAAIEEWRTEK